MEKLGLRRIEVFRLGARLDRAAAERDHLAAAVVDREHHPVLEPVVGHGDPLAVDQQPGLDHLLRVDALGGERVAQARTFRRGEAEPEGALRRRVEAAVGEIAARAGAGRLVEPALENLGGQRQHVVQAGARFLSRARFRRRGAAGRAPASRASRSTASGKLRPSVSTRN